MAIANIRVNAFRSLPGIAGDVTAPTYAELYSGAGSTLYVGGVGNNRIGKVSSSSQWRPRAIDAISVARVSERIGRACCGGIPSGERISRRRFPIASAKESWPLPSEARRRDPPRSRFISVVLPRPWTLSSRRLPGPFPWPGYVGHQLFQIVLGGLKLRRLCVDFHLATLLRCPAS